MHIFKKRCILILRVKHKRKKGKMSKEELKAKTEERDNAIYTSPSEINNAMQHLIDLPAIYAKLWENRIQL